MAHDDRGQPPVNERKGRAFARRASVAVGVLLGVTWAWGHEALHHASTPVKVLVGVVTLPLVAVELLWLCVLVAWAANEVRDWLWVQRENWRERR